MSDKRLWKSLEVGEFGESSVHLDIFPAIDHLESIHDTDRIHSLIRALDEFKNTDSMTHYFFAPDDDDDGNDTESSFTWGPRSQDDIDWSGFKEYVDRYL
ncbi:MAG: hypothetical protein O2821_12770 [Chloroflexi bacterium]|nr:hypothetical protein [Chloroflexota bacterium]